MQHNQGRSMKNWFVSIKVMICTLALLLATSCGEQPKLPEITGIKGPLFNLSNGQLLITVKLLRANLNAGARLPIPKTKNSFLEVTPNLIETGTLLVFTLDVEDLRSLNVGFGEGNTLPDGRPIPGVPTGTLENSLRADTEILDMSFYYHKDLFGIFIPIGWDTRGLQGSYKIFISNKEIGVLGAVASDASGHGAGITLFLKLNQLKDKQLQKMLQISKKHPGIIF